MLVNLKQITLKIKLTAEQPTTDVLRDVLTSVPLENLPNINQVNRQFSRICEENLQNRKHTIDGLIVSNYMQKLERIKTVDGQIVDYMKVVPFAEVKPPAGFKLNSIEIRLSADASFAQKSMVFFKVSKPMFDDVILIINFDYQVSHLQSYLVIFCISDFGREP